MVKNRFNVLILIFVLITLEGVSVIYSQSSGDTSSGFRTIPDGQTWFSCSKAPTNFISYMVKKVETSEKDTEGFGTIVVGNHPRTFEIEGLLVFVADYVNTQNFINPSRPKVTYYQPYSCFDTPVQECNQKTNPLLDKSDILCLAIANPNQREIKFSASISFDPNALQPDLIIPPLPDDNTTSTPKTPSPSSPTLDPSDTRSFHVNNSSGINFGYLLVISWLSSIFISILLNVK